MRKLILGLFFLMMIVPLGCGGGSQSIRQEAARDLEPIAEQTFYAPPEAVMDGLKATLSEYGFDVVGTRQLDDKTWSLDVKNVRFTDIDENIQRVLLEKDRGGNTAVRLMIPSSLWKGWGGNPGWSKSFFTRVFELMP